MGIFGWGTFVAGELSCADPVCRTIEVSRPGFLSSIYHEDESVPVAVLPGAWLPVREIFGD